MKQSRWMSKEILEMKLDAVKRPDRIGHKVHMVRRRTFLLKTNPMMDVNVLERTYVINGSFQLLNREAVSECVIELLRSGTVVLGLMGTKLIY